MKTPTTQERCHYCGRYFNADYRNRGRQKSCRHDSCRKKRKKAAQEAWLAKNRGYFKGRSENTKAWRKDHPQYQKTWRRGKRGEIQDAIQVKGPIKSIAFEVPVQSITVEIQDSCRAQMPKWLRFRINGRGVRYKTASTF